jgi:O-antigen/teichoic acid export membrane protein
MGKQFADQGHVVLALLAVAYALMALNVVPHYALLAFGRVRFIAGLNFASGVLLALLMFELVPPFGLKGAALGRIAYSTLLAVPYLIASRKAFKARAQLLPVGVS